MKLTELATRLEEQKVPSTIYSLSGGLPSEKHCISKVQGNNIWEVYYSERGSKSSVKVFYTEEKACEYFYDWVLKTAKSMDLI